MSKPKNEFDMNAVLVLAVLVMILILIAGQILRDRFGF